MVDMKEMIKFADLPMRQKLFFYELCKLGVVVFDLNNPLHQKILTQMINLVKEKADNVDESYLQKCGIANNCMLDALIVMQILKHAINPD